MSKKHKEKSMWDFTYEEQQAMLNSFDKKMDINSSSIETKNTDDNIITPKYDSINNFPSMEDQLMEFIKENNNNNNTTNDDAALATICVDTGDKDIVIADNPIPITDNTVQDKVTLSGLYGTKLTNLNDMSIKVEYIDELDKLIIDDGTTKKTFAIDRAVEDNIYDISEEDFDEEDDFQVEIVGAPSAAEAGGENANVSAPSAEKAPVTERFEVVPSTVVTNTLSAFLT